MCQESLKGVSMKYPGCFMQVTRCFKGVSREFQVCFILMVFRESFKGVTRVFQGCYKTFSSVF